MCISRRNPLFKTWTEALQEEVPLLVARSEIFNEMKPVVKYIELVQFQGGFIAGHYEIVFKVTLTRRHLALSIYNFLVVSDRIMTTP